MSEQNQMAISPITAGLVGAGVGALGGATIKAVQPVNKDYKDTKALLTMEKDKFEKIEKPADGAAAEVKDNYKVIEEGRKKISEAGDAFETNTIQPAKTEYETELKNQYGSEAEFQDDAFKKGDKTITELKNEVTTAEGKVTADTINNDADVKKAQKALDDAKAKVDVKTETKALEDAKTAARTAGVAEDKIAEDANVKAAQKALDDKIAADADVKAKTTELDKAKKAAVDKNADVASAKKALKEAETERLSKMEEKLTTAANAETDKTNGPLNKLLKKVNKAKEKMGQKFDAAKEAEELMKDSKYGTAAEKIKGLLPRAKMTAALIGAAALAAVGVAVSYIVGPKNSVPTDVA